MCYHNTSEVYSIKLFKPLQYLGCTCQGGKCRWNRMSKGIQFNLHGSPYYAMAAFPVRPGDMEQQSACAGVMELANASCRDDVMFVLICFTHCLAMHSIASAVCIRTRLSSVARHGGVTPSCQDGITAALQQYHRRSILSHALNCYAVG
jgi:hypothetical protein